MVPKSFSVLETLHHRGWKDVMEEEMESICENKTHILIDLLREKFPFKARWVFKSKIGNIRKVDRLKAKLVAKCCE